MEAQINPKKPWLKSYWIKFQSLSRFLYRAKRPFKLTRGGWLFILYTIGVGAGAINTGNNLLYLVFGLFLGMILASGVLSDLTLWGVEVEPLLPLSGQANQPLYIPLKVSNTKRWFSSLSVRIEMEGTLKGIPVFSQAYCASIERASSVTTLLVVHPGSRGWLGIVRLKLSTRFPFGLLNKSWTVPFENLKEGVVIHPALVPIKEQIFQSMSDREEQPSEFSLKGEGVDPYGVREYQASDNPKRIHWRASAKRSAGLVEGGMTEWLVKEMEKERDQRVTFQWPDVNFFNGWDAPQFEKFVSFTASLIRRMEDLRKETNLLIPRQNGWLQADAQGAWGFLSLVEIKTPSDSPALGFCSPFAPLSPLVEKSFIRLDRLYA